MPLEPQCSANPVYLAVTADLIVELPADTPVDTGMELTPFWQKTLRDRARQLRGEKQLLQAFRRVKRRAKYHFGDFQYLARMGVTLRGRPRMRLVTTSSQLDRRWLARNWRECGGTRVTNYLVLRSLAEIVEKCGFNDPFGPDYDHVWSRRVVRWTKGFFRDIEERSPPDSRSSLDRAPGQLSMVYVSRLAEFKWIRAFSELLAAGYPHPL